MKEFDQLHSILERLLGPGGCPWDQEQTLVSAREMILEEVCELIDAINQNDDAAIQEELGDLFFNVLFCCKLGEKEGRLKLNEVLNEINEKLIRRHPHIFGDAQIETSEEVLVQWEAIKKEEKGNADKKSALDNIPQSLPTLSRAQKILKKMRKTDYPDLLKQPVTHLDEEILGKKLLEIVDQAQKAGIDAEMALRKALLSSEQKFRAWE